MPKRDFNIVASHFIEITLHQTCSPVNLLLIFRKPFLKITSGRLLLNGLTSHCMLLPFLIRSSHQSCSIIKGVLRNFVKFTGKHLCQSLFFNKVAGVRPATLLKKRLWHRCFPVNFAKFLRTPFLQNTSGRLLLFDAYLYSYFNDFIPVLITLI